jgi:gamma-glutamyl hydrolase
MILFALLLVLGHTNAQQLNLRPIIGIVRHFSPLLTGYKLAEPPEDGPGITPTHSEFSADYVRWLSAGGARIAVLRFDMPEDKIKSLFTSINGLVFTGGGDTLGPETQYFKTASLLFNLAKEANDKGRSWWTLLKSPGDYFPIWGTCMGFQLLSILGAQDQTILHSGFDSYNYSIPLNLTPLAASSRFFTKLPTQVVTTLTTKNVTQNLHHFGVAPSVFTENANLAKIYRLLSVNADRAGRPFASTLEGINYPIYGTQWHPERNQFAWGPKEGLDKSIDAIRAMQSVANFFVGEARKSLHKFPTPQEEQDNLIFKWNPTFTGNQGDFPSEETYIFPLYKSQ